MFKKDTEEAYIISPIGTKMLNYKVYKMKTTEKIICFLGLFIVSGLVGLLFYGGQFKEEGSATKLTYICDVLVFIGVGIISNALFMNTIKDMKKNKRTKSIKKQFCDFLSALSTSMSSGMNVNDSLNNAYSDLCSQYTKESYIAKEVLEMINGIQNNIPIEETIKAFGERSGVEDIENFGIVFSICYRTGGNLKEIIKRSSSLISEKMMITEEINTKITSNKMQLNIMMALPIVMMFLMKNMSSQLAEGFTTMTGIIAETIAVGFFIVAYILGKKIMNVRG